MHQRQITLPEYGRGLHPITDHITQVVRHAGVVTGLCHVFVHHTSASLLIQENADPQVRADLEAYFKRIVPDGAKLFKHTAEGPDDMPAHVRSTLTATSLSIPISKRILALGQWQGIYLWEHRIEPRQRRITVTVQG